MYSFDVFDTLITRTTAIPSGIFALMMERLCAERHDNMLDSYIIDNFYELRIHSENLARASNSRQGLEEVTLRDIYDAMSSCGCLEEAQTEYLCHLEMETEIANTVGIGENIARVKELLARGESVILISDMYLPPETIRAMLLKADNVFEGLTLYVSSAYGKRKTTGNLYRLVQEKEQVGYGEWTHIGDNLCQDIDIPCQLGIRVELAGKPETTDFEKCLLDNYGRDYRLQMLIGAAIGATGRSGAGRPATDACYVGGRYAGPVLYSYAEWIVEQSVKKKIKRLYFIARDGYLIKKLVDIILADRKTPIETSYIYSSRKVWRMPSLSMEHYNLYQMMLWSHHDRIVTLSELAEVLHIRVGDLYDYLPGVYRKNRQEDHISNQELEYIVRKLCADESFKKFHLACLKEERKIVRQYLMQEIDLSDNRFAFVDVAGGGLTQGCLYELLKDVYAKPIQTFFFKIDRVNLVEGSVTNVFIPSFLRHDLVIEMLCRAPHGQTKGYAMDQGKVVPVLEELEVDQIINHGFFEYENGIVEYARLMSGISIKTGLQVASVKNILLYLEHIMEKPSREVLEYFASMPNNETGRGKVAAEYAPRLSEKDIEGIFLTRTNEPIATFYKGSFLAYSILRATPEEKALIEKYQKEHDGALGRLYRQDKEIAYRKLRERYGRAAFYPVRLLEEKLVLYGAGKFGEDLYRRLALDPEHEIVLWTDKNAGSYRQRGMADVRDVEEIRDTEYDQIVIAVMGKELAGNIREELVQQGIMPDKIFWIQPYQNQYCLAQWEVAGIG